MQTARSEIGDPLPKTLESGETLLDLVPGLREAVRDGSAIDIGLPWARPDEDDVGESLVVTLLDTSSVADPFGGLDGERPFIMMRDVLQHVRDYRGLLQAAFGRLAVDGWLLITVPHQFLRERKFRRPSRYQKNVERFYTPASLLFEVQEALDPTTYRVRLLKDDDSHFEYTAPISRLPTGNKRVVLVLQRIARPTWADEMGQDDDPRRRMARPDRVLAVDPEAAVRQHTLRSHARPVEKILVLKLDHRGDFLLSGMALRELRALFPMAHILLACASWNVATAHGSNLADEVLSFDFVAEDASADEAPVSPDMAAMRFAEALAGRDFTLAIDLSSHDKFRPLLERVKAKHKAGFDRWYKFPFLDIRLCLPNPSEEGTARQGLMPAIEFNTKRGIHKTFAIDFARSRAPSELGELLIWGPYSAFGAGEYELDMLLESLNGDQELGVDICCQGGAVRLFAGTFLVRKGHLPKVYLSLTEHVDDLEIRIFVIDNGPLNFRFSGVGFRREGALIGMHQMERMHLLVQLVNARMSLPYEQESVMM